MVTNRSTQALDFIMSCCRTVGAFQGTSDVHQYLKETAVDMIVAGPSLVFPERYFEHVAYAIDMVASNTFLSPPAAVASVYLVTRFEFYFRMLSGKLNGDGTWISLSEQKATQAVIKDKRLKSKRISNVSLAYKIMKINQSLNIVKACTVLDNSLYKNPTVVTGNMTVADIGDRIKFGRHSVGHGYWGDMSAEALFYGLLTAVIFYNQL